MSAEEKKKYAVLLTPYYRHENLPWMQKDYRDGYYA
jgi:hypothetical protein